MPVKKFQRRPEFVEGWQYIDDEADIKASSEWCNYFCTPTQGFWIVKLDTKWFEEWSEDFIREYYEQIEEKQ